MRLTHATLTPDDIGTLDEIEHLAAEVRAQAAHMGEQEVRYLVDTYYQMQERRKASTNQERGLNEAGEPIALTDFFVALDSFSETKLRHILQAYAEGKAAAIWAMSIPGIGPVIAAGLSAHIDITKAPTVGHIWRFAGYDPTVTWSKNEKRPWNAKLKVLCWKVGESFVKVKNKDSDIYGHVYTERRQLEDERNERGELAGDAEKKLKTTKIGKETVAYQWYSIGKLPPAHLHSRAKRYAVKLFLAHYHHVAYEIMYGTPPPLPYVITQLGHAHYIAPPNWPM